MRIRRKKWARPELAQCSYYISDAPSMKNKWNSAFENVNVPIYAEFGCGKGSFAAECAYRYPDINWLAFDIKSEMLAVARRNIEGFFESKNAEHNNLLLVSHNISLINKAIGSSDKIGRIYINFCNPWERGKHHKRRLTHPRQLIQYREFLTDGGEIRFKTDDDGLFEDSLEYFQECGFTLVKKTYDLHSEYPEDNIMTEHEKMFTEEGKKIKFLAAVKDRSLPEETVKKYIKGEETGEQDSGI